MRIYASQKPLCIDDLLDITRIDNGKLPLVKEPVDVPSLIDSALRCSARKSKREGSGYAASLRPSTAISRLILRDSGRSF